MGEDKCCESCAHWDSRDSSVGLCCAARGNNDGPKNPASMAYCPDGPLLTMALFSCSQFAQVRVIGPE